MDFNPVYVAAFLRPVFGLLFILVVAAPITWLLYRLVPEGPIKIALFRHRGGEGTTRHDRVVMWVAVLIAYAVLFAWIAYLSDSCHWDWRSVLPDPAAEPSSI